MSELPEKPLMDHVYDLLETIRKILLTIVAFMLALLLLPTPHLLPERYVPLTFYLMDQIRGIVLTYEGNFVLQPLAKTLGVNSSSVILISHGWFDSLTAAVITSALVGIVVLSPVVAYFIYRFIEPGLYPHEKRVVKRYLVAVLLLFVSGVVYGLYVVMPLTFLIALWLAQLGGAAPLFSIQDFYQNVFLGSVAVGVFFMFPIIVLTLSKIGVIDYETLRSNWRYVFFLTVALLVVLTPDPTPTSALALGLPFLGLYFLSMWLIKEKREKSK